MHINTYDWLIPVILLLFTIYGYFHGFLSVLIQMAGVILSFYLSSLVSKSFHLSFPWVSIVNGVVFFLTLTFFIILAKIVGKIGHLFPLSRFFSGVFGFTTGLTFSCYLILFLYRFFPQTRIEITNSFLAKGIVDLMYRKYFGI